MSSARFRSLASSVPAWTLPAECPKLRPELIQQATAAVGHAELARASRAQFIGTRQGSPRFAKSAEALEQTDRRDKEMKAVRALLQTSILPFPGGGRPTFLKQVVARLGIIVEALLAAYLVCPGGGRTRIPQRASRKDEPSARGPGRRPPNRLPHLLHQELERRAERAREVRSWGKGRPRLPRRHFPLGDVITDASRSGRRKPRPAAGARLRRNET
jgi:hypothetical protein